MIEIDFREKDILKYCIEQLNGRDIEIKTKNLLLGDILIDKLLIERKTINDLAASIVDGRYREQSFRLSKALEEGYKVFYFIEGNMDLYTGSMSKNTLVSTVYSLTNKGFQVLLTKNSKETSYFLLQFAEKIKKDKKKEMKEMKQNKEVTETITTIDSDTCDIEPTDSFVSSDTTTISIASKKESYENTEGIIQTKKNKNITKQNISVFMLCQIPGISTTTAGVLLEKYGHISNLIVAMTQNPNEIEEFRNKDKKLNKNIIKNMNEYLRI